MSPFDVSRLSGAAPIRGLARDGAGKTSGAAAASAPLAASGNGVAVETGARISAGQTPVDTDRVDVIRQALRDGSYPIVPAKITDALIAARLMLSAN